MKVRCIAITETLTEVRVTFSDRSAEKETAICTLVMPLSQKEEYQVGKYYTLTVA